MKIEKISNLESVEKEKKLKFHSKKLNFSRPLFKKIVLAVGILGTIFLIVNFSLYAYYSDKLYPNTYYQKLHLSNQSADMAAKNIKKYQSKSKIKVSIDDMAISVAAADLPIRIKWIHLVKNSIEDQKNNYWPIFNIFDGRKIQIKNDDLEYKKEDLVKFFDKKIIELNKDVTIYGSVHNHEGEFMVSKPMTLSEFDVKDLVSKIALGQKDIVAKRQATPRTEKLNSLSKDLNNLIDKEVSIKLKDKKIVIKKTDLATVIIINQDKVSYSINKPALEVLVSSALKPGLAGNESITNTSEIVDIIATNLIDKKPTQDIAAKFTTKTVATRSSTARRSYSYCVTSKNVSADNLNLLSSKAAAVFSDARGWSMGGIIIFRQVNSGCSFNLVLSAAADVPSFSSACSVEWSCRVGNNVIINLDRWNGASPAWNQAGGTLDDYRSMVINHEVGHFLGFGHSNCSAPGALASVMQQQSISLQGCQFNPWPTASELANLKSRT